MIKRQIFTLIFAVFVFFGLTGNVWGVSTNEATLPSNTPPEVKNLMDYIQARSGCSLGEANLVTTMLADQLSTTEDAAFLMYMMAPDNYTNVTGLNPEYTYRDYFENNPRYKAIKERLDGDMERYGRMSHDEKLAYIKHTDMDFVGVFNELTESGDLEKTLYVLENSNLDTLSDRIDKNTKISKDVTVVKKQANNIIDELNNTAQNITLAMLDYDCLKTDGVLNSSLNDINFSTSIKNLISTRDEIHDIRVDIMNVVDYYYYVAIICFGVILVTLLFIVPLILAFVAITTVYFILDKFSKGPMRNLEDNVQKAIDRLIQQH